MVMEKYDLLAILHTPFNNTFHVSRITAGDRVFSFLTKSYFSVHILWTCQPTNAPVPQSQSTTPRTAASIGSSTGTNCLFFSSIYHYLFFLSSNNLSDPTIQLLLFYLFIHHRSACNAVQAHTSPAASLRRYPWLLCVLDLGNCPKTPTPSPTKTKLQYCSAASPPKNENKSYRSSQQSPLKGPLTHGHFKGEDDCPVCVEPSRSSNMGR